MAFALLVFGLIAIVAGIRGKHDELFALLKDDFTGSQNFFVWVMAIAFLVMIGNVERIRPVSDAFLGLIIVVMILANGRNGLFDKFVQEVKAGTQ